MWVGLAPRPEDCSGRGGGPAARSTGRWSSPAAGDAAATEALSSTKRGSGNWQPIQCTFSDEQQCEHVINAILHRT